MNYIKQSIWAFAAIALVACSSDDDKDTTESLTPVENTSTSFSATIETGNSGSSKATRTTLITDADVPYPVWSSGDQLHIYNATTPANALFDLKSNEYVGQRQGVFDGTITKNAGDKFFALYCSTLTGTGAPTLTASNGSATISATIPSALVDYTAGFHPEYHFMTGYTTENTFKLKNAMSLIKINLADNNYANFAIRKIHFKAINGENIAGTFTASIGDDGTIGTPSITSGGSSEIVISNSDGSALATGVYYISVLPATLTGGFTLTFENTEDGAIYERSNTKANYTIGKSEIINLGSFTAQACAKEAYVDLGLTNSEGKSILWCVENIYDDGFTDENSFYSWGETSVKANQTKVDKCKYYSWYYDYGIGEGSSNSDITKNLNKRCYKYGLGPGALNDAADAENRYEFIYSYYIAGIFQRTQYGLLLKYNSYSTYGGGTITDWGSGVTDGKTVLEVADDAAYQKSNGKWRIPTSADFETLINSSTTIDKNNQFVHSDRPLVAGPAAGSNNTKYKFKNRTTGHYIILPLKGYRFRSKESESNDNPKNTTYGYYWTRNLASESADSYKAKALKVDVVASESGNLFNGERAAGLMIRGVMYR